jgi:hypothetical protein
VSYLLHGRLPDSIGSFPELESLALSENFINGTIPAAIGNLTNARDIFLQINDLKGTLPETLGSLQRLRYFDCGNNLLHGPLPTVLCQLPQLEVYYTYYNRFTGTIPDCLFSMTKLAYLDISQALVTGTLPTSLANLPLLISINIYQNFLEGTIPYALSGMTQLEVLELGYNFFYGTIPSEWSSLVNLVQLSIAANYFNGTVPSYLGSIESLQYLNIFQNRLTGTLPTSLANLQQLQVLDAYLNHFSGPLPTWVCTLPDLLYLDLGSNAYHGTIPECYGDIAPLQRLYLDINALTGTIPASLCSLTDLRYFYLRQNQLHGTAPACIGDLTKLLSVYIYSNALTGTIPAEWAQLTQLQYLDVGSNQFHGTVPSFLPSLEQLRYLYIDVNLFTGSIPAELGRLVQIREMLLQYNSFTGTIPSSLSGLANLSVLAMQSNYLTGSLNGVVNSTVQVYFTTFKFNDNKLTGSLPDELFRLPNLRVLVGATNCFRGNLPISMCDSPTLTTISMDGMGTAKTCRDSIFPGFSSAYLIDDGQDQPFLACLFKLPLINTLHLSGNSFTGTLPDIDALDSSLVDLGLAHNKLTGTIPAQIQQKDWYRLDLSYNRLSGTLKSDFASGVDKNFDDDTSRPLIINSSIHFEGYTLAIENNRLSGRIPERIVSLKNISMLGSNLFACALGGTNLPQHDPDAERYNCGSTSFDVPYYAWLILFGGSVGAIASVWQWLRSDERVITVLRNLRVWLAAVNAASDNAALNERIPNTALISRICYMLCRTTAVCLTYILLLLLPLYAALGVYYGTLTHQYTYHVSGAFFSGKPPAGAMLVTLIGLLLIFVAGFVRHMRHCSAEETSIRIASRSSRNMSGSTSDVATLLPPASSWMRNAAMYLAFAFINLIVVVGVNIAYVYVVIYKSAKLLLLAQILIAVFKLLWNGVGSQHLTRLARRRIAEHQDQTIALETRFIMVQVLTALINNIVVPCVVVAFVSPSCYYNVFSPAPTITTPFGYVLCVDFVDGNCINKKVELSTTVYEPSFSYYYQCSSSIVTYYAPAFVALCIIAGFVVPAVEMFALYRLRTLSPTSLRYRIIDYWVPSILRPFDPNRAVRPDKRFVQVNRLMVVMTSYTGLMLTFGALFPPLGAALGVTLISVTYFTKVKVGWFLTRAVEQNRIDAVNAVEAECQRSGAVEVLRRSAWMLVAFSCWFYALFVFDTLGDATGLKEAYWVLIVMPLMPAAIFAAYSVAVRWQGAPAASAHALGRTESRTAGEIELDVKFAPGANAKQQTEKQSVPANDDETNETFNVLRS